MRASFWVSCCCKEDRLRKFSAWPSASETASDAAITQMPIGVRTMAPFERRMRDHVDGEEQQGGERECQNVERDPAGADAGHFRRLGDAVQGSGKRRGRG